jgi:mutator protein MutT
MDETGHEAGDAADSELAATPDRAMATDPVQGHGARPSEGVSGPPGVVVALGAVVAMDEANGPMVLITRRSEHQVLAGYWELPGGKCEVGENVADCLVRELAEEVSLAVTPREPLTPIDYRYEHGHVQLHPWLCDAAAPDHACPLGVGELRWVGPDALDQYPFPPANAPLMIELARRLRSSGGHPDTVV